MPKQKSLSRFLTPASFELGKTTTLKVDPATQFGFIGTDVGGVERVRGTPQVIVPVYDWQATGVSEEEVFAKVLAEAAEASPLKVASPADLVGPFWAQLRGIRALLINPSMVGRFLVPIHFDVLKFEAVPENRAVVLKTPDLVGYHIKQGHRRNILVHNKWGVTALQFYAV